MPASGRTARRGPHDPIKFGFDERKAAAAAAYLLELAGGEMEYLLLLKLLYYADRESLDRLGAPITGDDYVSMKHGPVLSHVYNLIKLSRDGQSRKSAWFKRIESVQPFKVKLASGSDLGPLSDAEVAILKEVFEGKKGQGVWKVRDGTHKLKEWEDPGKSSKPIQLETMLTVLGKSDQEIADVRRRARERRHFQKIFES